MQPGPTSTLGATITMVSRAGLGPYNPPIIGTAPGTLLMQRNDFYEAAVKEIKLFWTH